MCRELSSRWVEERPAGQRCLKVGAVDHAIFISGPNSVEITHPSIPHTRRVHRHDTARTMMTAASPSMPRLFSFLLVLLFSFSSSPLVSASIPLTFRHTNLLRTIDLTKPYVRDSTALIVENISNATQSVYYWGIPLDLVPKLSYLEIKEKKAGNSELFRVEPAAEDHSYLQICWPRSHP